MNCPQCRSKTLAAQQFCRSCGAQLTAEQRSRFNPQLLGLMMAFGGIMVALTGGTINVRTVVLLGVFISISGMFFIAAYPMLRSSLKRQKTAALPQESLANAPTTKKLSPIGDFEYVPASVTESTTNLLREPATTRARSRARQDPEGYEN